MSSDSEPGGRPDKDPAGTSDANVPDAQFEEVSQGASETSGASDAPGGGVGAGNWSETAVPDPVREALWPRILYMLGYGIAGYFTMYVLVALTIVQLIVILVARDANDDLKLFSKNLVTYLAECMSFITYGQEEKPFPFGPFPKSGPNSGPNSG